MKSAFEDSFMAEMPVIDPDTELHRRRDDDEHGVLIIYQSKLSRYHEISEARAVIWALCDGSRTVSEIAILVAQKGGPKNAQIVAGVIQQLKAKGLLRLAGETAAEERNAQPADTISATCRNILTWKVRLSGVDATADWLYHRLGHWFFSLPAKILITASILSGGPAFLYAWASSPQFITPNANQIWLLVLSMTICLSLHETAHAMAVKHFGRKVIAIGLGWFWVGPFFYVDTSDMWLAPKRQRIIVSIAGPIVNLSIGALSSIAAMFLPSGPASFAILIAATQYFSLLFSLAPFLEYDGYYALVDLLNRPNLRRTSFRWLFTNFQPTFSWFCGAVSYRRVDLLYTVGSLIYLPILVGISATANFSFFEALLRDVQPSWLVEAAALAITIFLSVFLVCGLFYDLRQLTDLKGD